jgi:CheY-like chemotaxis protein
MMINPTVLVVDDSLTDLRMAAQSLQRLGCRVVTASDGEDAILKARGEHPNLILLDVLMPKKNGFQVCRHLKTSPDTRDIKIMLLTGKTQESDRFWGMKQGADVYLTKPYSEEQLLEYVSQLL